MFCPLFVPKRIFISGSAKTVFACSVDKLSLILLKIICDWCKAGAKIPINIPLSLNVFSLSSFRNIGILAKIGKIMAHPDTIIPTVWLLPLCLLIKQESSSPSFSSKERINLFAN